MHPLLDNKYWNFSSNVTFIDIHHRVTCPSFMSHLSIHPSIHVLLPSCNNTFTPRPKYQ